MKLINCVIFYIIQYSTHNEDFQAELRYQRKFLDHWMTAGKVMLKVNSQDLTDRDLRDPSQEAPVSFLDTLSGQSTSQATGVRSRTTFFGNIVR